MPTIRPTKRLLLPTDKRQKRLIENIVNDQSTLWGVSNSDAIIRDILESELPQNPAARINAEMVYAGDMSLLSAVASILRQNVTGSVGHVKEPDYRPIPEFGLDLMQKKGLAMALDTRASVAHHFRSRFTDVVDYLEALSDPEDDIARDYELVAKVKYGRDLLVEADPDRFDSAPAQGYVQFALESFELVGKRNDTCAYLADVFEILGKVEKELAKVPSAFVPPDDARDRSRWSDVLKNVTGSWTAT